MADLFVVGPNSKDCFRKTLPERTPIRIGRAPRNGWGVPWDMKISREHLDLQLLGETLRVTRLGTARNSVVFNGEPRDDFEMTAGETFRIGETVFHFQVVRFESGPSSPVSEHSFAANALQDAPFSDPTLKLEVLSRLPTLISESRTDGDLARTIVAQSLEAIPDARIVSVIRNREPADVGQNEPELLCWDSRSSHELFRPSRKLLARTLKLRASVLHVWNEEYEVDESLWTRCGDLDWAFCVPVQSDSCPDWCIYVAGRGGASAAESSLNIELHGDMRFAELLAEFVRAFRTVRVLERRHAEMGQFFSPAVVETLVTSDSEKLLQPRTQEASVLFCDLRGFSQTVEQASDSLHALLRRVSEALGVMTRNIMKFEGVVADFQGDAALGFWGWPASTPEDPLSACRAALMMQSEFLAADGHQENPLAGFRVGIGICHGTTIAGKIGTSEQAKVGVFGPVVNLAARLEGLTKRCGVSILIDEATASHVRELPDDQARCRRIACVRPAGISTPVMVSELVPPTDECRELTEAHLKHYEKALDAFIQGKWSEARGWLAYVPDGDGAKQFLSAFQDAHHQQPPEDWDGVICFQDK